ncbi:hypothetical protein A79_1945 [Vibrio parahaemolyticus AQ3810]|nr:hypothetical protein A79_1945 [Vibrio parahaemolyticus AQ3810]EXF66622.1 hypothetical protein D030_5458 [Vibrio parahaemolyticus AQ3810]
MKINKKFSAHCATNKAFKADSQRVAFWVLISFRVYGTWFSFVAALLTT